MKCHRLSRSTRRGAVAVLVLFLLVAILGCVSLALDLGYLTVARTEMQRTADSAALAAAWELIDENMLTGDFTMEGSMADAREQAAAFATANRVCTKGPNVDTDADNSPERDVVVGTLWNFSDHTEEMSYANPADYNVVRVRIRRTPEMNGQVPVFFAQIWGRGGCSIQAEATAGTLKNVGGFKAPSNSGETLGILPFALDVDTWNAVLAQQTADEWSWDNETKTIVPGPDGVHECNLFPQGTGSPGNRGTIDIGSDNNSTADIADQITGGVTAEDLEYHGGKLQLDENGELLLNGDTGISAGVKDELASIKGQARIIPIFSQVVGPGNNAEYTIVKFCGVRILDVKLTGSNNSKCVIIQPANVVTKGAIAGPEQENTSYFIYSYPALVR